MVVAHVLIRKNHVFHQNFSHKPTNFNSKEHIKTCTQLTMTFSSATPIECPFDRVEFSKTVTERSGKFTGEINHAIFDIKFHVHLYPKPSNHSCRVVLTSKKHNLKVSRKRQCRRRLSQRRK